MLLPCLTGSHGWKTPLANVKVIAPAGQCAIQLSPLPNFLIAQLAIFCRLILAIWGVSLGDKISHPVSEATSFPVWIPLSCPFRTNLSKPSTAQMSLPESTNRTKPPLGRTETFPAPQNQNHGLCYPSSSTRPQTSLLMHQQKQVGFQLSSWALFRTIVSLNQEQKCPSRQSLRSHVIAPVWCSLLSRPGTGPTTLYSMLLALSCTRTQFLTLRFHPCLNTLISQWKSQRCQQANL